MVLRTTAASGGTSVLTIAAPGKPVKTVRFPRTKTRVVIPFTAPAGESRVKLAVDGPDLGGADPRDLRAQLFSLSVAEDVDLPTIKP
jgi:hypothetical protein